MMTDNKNKTICALGWDHLHVTIDGWVAPCCIWNYKAQKQHELYNLKDHTLAEAINSPGMMSMRKAMLEGKRHPLCLTCDKQEDAGIESLRDVYNFEYLDKIDEEIMATDENGRLDPDKFAPRYIDVRFSNLCNMRCRMCSHQASSAWYNEIQSWYDELEISNAPTYYDAKFFNHSKITKEKVEHLFDEVDKVYFAGGEPLILEEHYRVLNRMINSGRAHEIELMYNTNLTVDSYKGVKLTEYWKHFKHVKIMGSVDGMDEVYDYIRTGGTWKKAQEIFNSFKTDALPNMRVEICLTVSIQNIFQMPKFIKWCHENEWMHKGRNRFGINFVQDPAELDIIYLPEDVKQQIVDEFEELKIWLRENRGEGSDEDVQNFITYINKSQPSDELRTKMLNKLKYRMHAHDITASLDWQSSLPELKDVLKDYESVYWPDKGQQPKYKERDRE